MRYMLGEKVRITSGKTNSASEYSLSVKLFFQKTYRYIITAHRVFSLSIKALENLFVSGSGSTSEAHLNMRAVDSVIYLDRTDRFLPLFLFLVISKLEYTE